MFIFISNVAREYAWGDTESIPEILGEDATGEPQAELWLGTHIDDPAELAHVSEKATTLLDLIQGDVDKYGVDGAGLPFLLKVLGIGQPLSVQAHPNKQQAVEGFERENALGVAREAAERNYRDPNHKPEVVVALSDDFAALAGFRPLSAVVADLRAMAVFGGESAESLGDLADWISAGVVTPASSKSRDAEVRSQVMNWIFAGSDAVAEALEALSVSLGGLADERRARVLRELLELHPNDPGVLVSLLMNLVHLEAGEALYLPPQHIHAYLSGVAIEVMASSDNVLRAGLTEKHIDAEELRRVIEFEELADPRLPGVEEQAGVTLWQPDVPDFSLRRLRMQQGSEPVSISADYPLVLIATEGKVVAERSDDGLDEFANIARGQALYVSAGEPVTFTGNGALFIATVGESWGRA